MGRDKIYCFLRHYNLLVPNLKNYHVTTNSNHQFRKYKILVKEQVPTRPEQLWVSDITYIKTQNGHNYPAMVTDAYSKQIMVYKLDSHEDIALHGCSPWPLKTGNILTKNLFIIRTGVFNIVIPNTQSSQKIMELL